MHRRATRAHMAVVHIRVAVRSPGVPIERIRSDPQRIHGARSPGAMRERRRVRPTNKKQKARRRTKGTANKKARHAPRGQVGRGAGRCTDACKHAAWMRTRGCCRMGSVSSSCSCSTRRARPLFCERMRSRQMLKDFQKRKIEKRRCKEKGRGGGPGQSHGTRRAAGREGKRREGRPTSGPPQGLPPARQVAPPPLRSVPRGCASPAPARACLPSVAA